MIHTLPVYTLDSVQKVKMCSYLVESLFLWLAGSASLMFKKTTTKMPLWAREMAQWAKVPVAKSDSLHLLNGPHVVERENQLLKVVL